MSTHRNKNNNSINNDLFGIKLGRMYKMVDIYPYSIVFGKPSATWTPRHLHLLSLKKNDCFVPLEIRCFTEPKNNEETIDELSMKILHLRSGKICWIMGYEDDFQSDFAEETRKSCT